MWSQQRRKPRRMAPRRPDRCDSEGTLGDVTSAGCCPDFRCGRGTYCSSTRTSVSECESWKLLAARFGWVLSHDGAALSHWEWLLPPTSSTGTGAGFEAEDGPTGPSEIQRRLGSPIDMALLGDCASWRDREVRREIRGAEFKDERNRSDANKGQPSTCERVGSG